MPSIDLRPTPNRNPKDKRPVREMPFDIGLRKFKKACEKAGIVQEVRERQYYEKPAQRKLRKKAEAVSRTRKEQRMINAFLTPSKARRR
jgi:small subunit ribosomal protein S21|tara:strand:+ start:365 stop:631 length:267 start_codon:yes stop_codon:yes gene_type:complete